MTAPATRPQVEHFFDEATCTLSYLVWDRETLQCEIVDSVLDYDPKSGQTSHASADRLIARVRELGGIVAWILETHAHADHLSAAPYLKRQLGGRTAIGRQITTVQEVFGHLFNAGLEFSRDGRQFDRLLDDGEWLSIGGLQLRAMHTPGHTPACMSYVVSDGQETAMFVGDTIFSPDYGTARCDFPGGDARTLYRSIRKLLGMSPETRLYFCHDYLPGGRALQCWSTVADERRANIHVHDGIDEQDFVTIRQVRDASLDMPTLLLPAVQVNMRAGEFPPPEANGLRYLKIPLNAL